MDAIAREPTLVTVAPALLSAAVILVRPAATSLEVLMLRRGASAAAFGGAWVFPGGLVQAGDREPAEGDFGEDEALAELTRRGGVAPTDAGEALAIWRAALRELFEEAGVLLARSQDGAPFCPTPDDAPRWLAWREALLAGQISLVELLARERLRADYRRLIYYSHWITPTSRPHRFDTRFFVAAMPPEQDAAHCGIETSAGTWVEPHDALGRYHAGGFPLVLPTRLHLQRLSAQRSAAAVLDDAARKQIRTVLPDPADPARRDGVWQPTEAPTW